MANFNTEDKHLSGHNKIKISAIGLCTCILTLLAFLLFLSFSRQKDNLRTLYVISFAASIILILLLILILVRLFSSLDLINERAKILSQGNLNISDILVEKTKGLENLTIAFNDMKSNFLSFIELTKGNIIVLSNAIEKVSGSINMSFEGNEQIAASMSQVAGKAQEQLELAKETIDGLEESSLRIEKITENIDGIEKYIEGTVKDTQVGTRTLENFYYKLNIISSNLDNTNRFIEKLNEEINKISEISEFIIQVSDQLNMLGLNASIEAARTGESGKGFMVVAKEIRELSGKTKEGIIKINEIVEEVTKRSRDVNDSVNSFVNGFNESRENFDLVKESFMSINEQGGVINKEMKEIYKEINLISSFTKETRLKGTRLYDASNEISSKTQNVAAITEEALAELEQITGNTAALNEMLVRIRNLVKKFNTSVSPVEQRISKRLRIAFLSLDDNEFWSNIKRGVIYAQKELSEKNTLVDYFGFTISGDKPLEDRVVDKMRECINDGYDGIVIPGFFRKTIPLVEEASRKGIGVTVFNCDLSEKSSRLAHFSPNIHESGKLAGELLVRAIGGSGKIIMARGDNAGGVHGARRDAIIKVLNKNKRVKLIKEMITEDDAQLVYKEVKACISSNYDVKGVLVTGGGLEGAAKAIEELGLIGKVKVVGFDHSKEIFEYVKKGIIYAALGQDPFGQGHDPVVFLYNHIVTGTPVENENMWSRLDVVDENNVNDLLAL